VVREGIEINGSGFGRSRKERKTIWAGPAAGRHRRIRFRVLAVHWRSAENRLRSKRTNVCGVGLARKRSSEAALRAGVSQLPLRICGSLPQTQFERTNMNTEFYLPTATLPQARHGLRHKIVVRDYEAALLYRHGKLARQLAPGRHIVWGFGYAVSTFDLRKRVLR
jgi:hypothetical protein